MHECKDATVQAAKRILRYLIGSKNVGLEYSPEIEKNFRETYAKIAKDANKNLPDTIAFSDSDFAGDSVQWFFRLLPASSPSERH